MLVYTDLADRAVQDMARTVPALAHIDPRRVLLVAGSRACTSSHGNLAQCYALREDQADGFTYWYHPRSRCVVRVTPWARRQNTRISIGGSEMLYLVLLRLPRLLMHDPLATLIHELIHISPDFDGRLHRLRHGRKFDTIVRECVAQWQRLGDPALVEAMQMDHPAIQRRWGSLVARGFGPQFAQPHVRPLENPPPVDAHPDFRRKRLTWDPKSLEVVPGKWTPAHVPASLTEKDLVYRVYGATGGARRIAASAVGPSRVAV